MRNRLTAGHEALNFSILVRIQVPQQMIVKITILLSKPLWPAFGRCYLCGTKLKEGGWYNEKTFCPKGHDLTRHKEL